VDVDGSRPNPLRACILENPNYDLTADENKSIKYSKYNNID